MREVIERLPAIPLPAEEPASGRDPIAYPGGAGNVSRGESLQRGVGFAVGFKNIAYSEGFDDSAEATVTLRPGPDGPVASIRTAAVDFGQGLYTVLTQIVRTELGVERRRRRARRHRERLGRLDLRLPADDDERRRRARRLRRDQRELGKGPLEEPISRTFTYHHRPTTELDEHGQGDPHVAFAFVAERAVVEVDAELGLVARRPDRRRAGRRPRDQPTGRDGPDRGRHGDGDRARA